MFKWLTALVVLTASGVLWGARLENKSESLDVRITRRETHDEKSDVVLSHMNDSMILLQERQDAMKKDLEGKIHGVSILMGKSREDIKRTIKEASE
jgi:hypothetical protein